MTNMSKGLLSLIVILCVGVGCKAPDIDLSPEGKSIAIAEDRGLILRSVDSKSADRVIPLKEARGPLFSPDGKWIVINEKRGTFLVDRNDNHLIPLPKVEPPFAWRPDGSELVGFMGNSASIVHITSRSVVRQYSLPGRPEQAVWLGGGRDLAFTMGGDVLTVCQGIVHRRHTTGKQVTLARTALSAKVVWVVASEVEDNDGVPNTYFAVWASDPSLFETSEPLLSGRGSDLIGAKPPHCFLSTLSVAPDGKHLAFGAARINCPEELMREYVRLGGFRRVAHANRAKRRLTEIERHMSFTYLYSVAEMKRGRLAGPARQILSVPLDETLTPRWSADGTRLIVFGPQLHWVKTISL